jgi:shikimate kinase/3-dehydroquinate synthase
VTAAASTPIFLIGLPAAGKTTVGRLVAEQLGRRFLDLDDAIAAAAGTPVPALVAADEPGFRRREAAALAAAIDAAAAAGESPVIATGGGCAAHGDNLERMRGAGLVVALAVGLSELRRRAAGATEPVRPLLARDDAALAALAAAREPFYRRAHAGVATDGVTAAEVARTITRIATRAAALAPADAAAATWVGVGDRAYPVVTRAGGVDGALVAAAVPDATRIAIVTDDHVAGLWLDPLVGSLAAAHGEEPAVVRVPPGEATKSLAVFGRVCDELVGHGLDRGGAIVALGGGVVGDLAGLVAATLFRGLPWVQVPTTLVAMTDSAIGGKTGIDLAAGKNLVGAFWQPALVAIHLPVLATLPARERRAGFGELWKYALLDGPALWAAVDALAPWAAAGERAAAPPEAAAVIHRAAAFKAWIVGLDEREQRGQRMLLNLGHTVGHAIEAELGMLHGEAVGLGLVAACHVSAALGLCAPGLADELGAALTRSGLAADPRPLLTEAVIARIGVDKKRRGAIVRFVAIREVGRCEVVEVPARDLATILRSARAL